MESRLKAIGFCGTGVQMGRGLGGQWFHRSERLVGWSEIAQVPPGRIQGWSKVFQIYSIGTSSSDLSVTFPG